VVTRALRTEKLDLRISAEAKQVIADAASVAGQSVSDFMLTSALARAEEILPDRRYFGLTTEQWTDFMAALDAPPTDHPRLRRLLREPSVFDLPDPQ
jgi:uncharacterized protein (DUF1778 family)